MKSDPAFPQNRVWNAERAEYEDTMTNPGMSQRDWFAGQALPALIARHRADVSWNEIAPLAYQLADAMIAAGNQKPVK